MKKYLLSIFCGLILVFSTQAQTMFGLVEASPNHTILEDALVATNLNAAFDGGGPISLMAPDDAAFEALPEGLVDLLLTDPGPEGVLYELLLYHGVVPAVGVGGLTDGAILNTFLTDQTQTVANDGTTITINGSATVTQSASASNGILHVVDGVLIPSNAPTVYDWIAESDDHNTLEAAIDAAGLDVALETSPALTVFAPTDAAFAALPIGLLDALLTDPDGLLAAILQYHVAEGIAASSSLSQDQMITTLQGEDVTVDLVGGVFINGAQVIIADVPTINGVVHVLDAVLVPTDLPTVVDIVVDSPDHNTLEAAVVAAELDDDLTEPGQFFTVFAPTDAAFDLLPAGLVDALLTDPTGILANILLQHVLGSIETSGDLNDGDVFTTLLGQDVTVSNDGTTISINGATVSIANIPAINGIVHVIDAVIIPADQNSVYDIISNSPDHGTLLTAVDAAGLDVALQNGAELTVFAPTDAAFAEIQTVVDELLLDPTGALTNVLLYHVVGAIALSGDLTDGQTVLTLQGETVTVTIDGSTVNINGAEVTLADIPAINGVVHVIDAVLVPSTCTQTAGGPYTNFTTAFGGVPVEDGGVCPFNVITGFQSWASESYIAAGATSGVTYEFGLSGGSTGAWDASFVIIDAVTGEVIASADGTSIQWTAPADGD
ncbi:MAG: fasciclin domain-containing protein, partial [Flavobacteriales bacterium]|nr:fasciclin domain-containing protein [Flavobacteriales bacterium]